MLVPEGFVALTVLSHTKLMLVVNAGRGSAAKKEQSAMPKVTLPPTTAPPDIVIDRALISLISSSAPGSGSSDHFFSLSAYTAVTISNYGWNLIPVFFGDMRAMTWPGQFNFDFMGFLFLSGLWVSWRHQFSVVGIGLGAVAVFGGMLFLSLYLFVASTQANGNLKEVLMGSSRRDN
jgi:hypothetical protein